MSGESRLRQIYEFRTIDGINKNPSIAEHNKFHVWNNDTQVFDYTCIGKGHIDIDFFVEFISNVIEETDTNTYLSSINKVGNYGRFTLTNGTNLYLKLGELAWLDEIPPSKYDLGLPGNKKVLFDDNDSLGGEAAFKYDKTLNRVQFEGTGLVFDLTSGTEGTYKEGVKYLGNYSWSFGQGTLSVNSGSYNLFGGYRAGSSFGSTSTRNLILGNEAGYLAGDNLEGSIFIGAFSGKYETASNKFFIDNQDYLNTTTARDNSFLYADLETERRLYIRDRLSVEKEGKFGTSGLADVEGEYGMYQMSAATGGNPQWHDGSVWQDFANSTNTYLDDVTYSGGELTFTLSDASTIGPINISDVNSTLFATSPSSPSTGQTGTSDYGYIQISDNSFTNNEGLTYKAGFKVDSNELYIPGAINLSAYTSSIDNSIWTDGTHGYINLSGVPYQIDNDVLDAYYGVNIGGGTYEVFKQINGDNQFEFRTFRSTPIGSNNPNDRIKFSYSSDGDVIFIGTTAERNRLDTVVDSAFSDVAIDRDNSGETLLMRALRPGSGVTLTQNEEYIQIDAVTSGGGGEVNTMTNLGAGEGVYYQKNGVQFELKSLTATDSRLSYSSSNSEIDIALSLTPATSNLTNSTAKTYSGSVNGGWLNPTSTTPTLQFKKLISDSITITENADELILESSAGTASNIGGGALEIYKTGSSLPFEFRTISNIGDHMSIRYIGDVLRFDVDAVQLTDLGAGVYSIVPESNGFNFSQKAFTEGYAISLDNTTDSDLIEVGVSELIPQFSFTTTPVYTSGLLEFKANYSNDIVNTAPAATTLFEINIGDGLVYTPATNTLSTNQANVGIGTDYALRDVSVSSDTATEKTYTLEVTDGISTTENTYDIVIPKYQLSNAGDETGSIGGIKIEDVQQSWKKTATTGEYTHPLYYDNVTGILKGNKYLVSYEEQNFLHDADNSGGVIGEPTFNKYRAQARANIGAAYVNGKVDEDFTAKDLVVEDSLTAADTSKVHSIGALRNKDNGIYSSGNSVIIAPNARAFDEDEVSVEVTTTGIRIRLYDDTPLEVYSVDTGMSMLKFIGGDLYITGSLRVGGTIEMFDTDAQNI